MEASRYVIQALCRSPLLRTGLLTRVTAVTARRPARSMTIDSKVTMSQTMVKKAGSNSADAIFMFPKGATLPHTHQLEDGVSLRIENITEDRIEEAWTMFQSMVNKGEGYSQGEFETLEEFAFSVKTKKNYFQLVHTEDSKILAATILLDTPMSRSEKSVHFSSLVALNDKYRFKGYGRTTVFQVVQELGRSILGYPGFISARGVIKSVNAVRGTGATFHGIIADCSHLTGKGWVTDLVFTTVEPRLVGSRLSKMPPPELPLLICPETIPNSLQSDEPPMTNFPQITLNDKSLGIELAGPKDIWRVEEMIRDAAEQSDGFAIDEFNNDGHFNRKLLYDSHVVVAKTSDDVIIASAIFGPTRFCRAYNPAQVGGYILVNKDFRGHGFGKAFAKYMLIQAKEMGYTTVITDAFSSNIRAMQMMEKMGFMIMGTLPHSGYIKSKGYKDSYMFSRSV